MSKLTYTVEVLVNVLVTIDNEEAKALKAKFKEENRKRKDDYHPTTLKDIRSLMVARAVDKRKRVPLVLNSDGYIVEQGT